MRNALSKSILISSCIALAFAVSCGAEPASATADATRVAVSVVPSYASMLPKAAMNFTAAVTGSAITAVRWEVRETGGGSVDATGMYTAPETPGDYHVVVTSAVDATASATALVRVAPPGSTTSKWVMGYWPTWSWNWSRTPVFDTTAMTHVAVAHWLTTTSGGLTQGSGLTTARAQQIASILHAGGVKAIMMIGGSDDPNWGAATSAANRATFVANVIAEMDRCGFDGVDLDWEAGLNVTQLVATARDLRAARPSMIITVALGNWASEPVSVCQQLHATVDQLNVMTYDMSTAGTWYHSALYSPAYNGTSGNSSNQILTNIRNAGVPMSKVGIGIPFYGYIYPGPYTGPGQGGGGRSMTSYNAIYPKIQNTTYTFRWDDAAKQPAVFNGSEWIGYEDEASIAAKAAYADTYGLGGAIIWTVEEGAVPGMGNPLLSAVKQYFLKR